MKWLSAEFVRRSVAAHGWLGLLAGAGMYLLCLTGTVLVFHQELVRWEQPSVEEFLDVDPAAVERAVHNLFSDSALVTPHLWVVLPTRELPRLRIASETMSWFLNQDGSVGETERNAWSEALIDLHYYLHLPPGWGMVVVSTFGALLVALIVSGIFAHPRIFKDAFRLRVGGSRKLEQTDIHNRLSVWGVPFHLMIGITGAYFGFALPIMELYARVHANTDQETVVESVFGGDPALAQEPSEPQIEKAFTQLRQLVPDQPPFLITLHEYGTPGQYVEMYVLQEQRLTYSENYLFDTAGEFLGKRGFSDGPPGTQAIYSLYRLHFGRFGGFGVKLLYGVLGLALTVASATGINIWLAKRRSPSYLDDLWAGVVWGAPLGIACSALASVVLSLSPVPSFWLVYLATIGYSLLRRDDASAKRDLRWAGGAAIVSVAVSHALVFDAYGGFAGVLNAALGFFGATLVGAPLVWRAARSSRQPDNPPDTALH